MTMASWLNKEFVQHVLRNSENDDTICVTNISTTPATNKGDNYSSEMIRVSVDFERCKNSEIIKLNRSIIIKMELTKDETGRKLVELAGVFDSEMMMMTVILKEMNAMLKDTKLSSECLYIQKQNPSMLVLEDLTVLGFRMVNRQTRLDFEHCRIALRNLAKFHAASVAICEKTPKYKDILRKGIFHPDNPPDFTQFFVVGLKKLAKEIISWPGFGKSYSDKLMKLSEVICGKVADCQERDDNEFNVINHGDFWINNMLFKYDDDGKVIDHIMVDFQLCYYGSPAMDLQYFINICLSEAVLDNETEELIVEYLRVLTTTMQELECKTHPPDMTALKEAMQKREIFGFLSACTVIPVILVDKNDAPTCEDMMSESNSSFNDKAFQNEVYKTELSKKLRRWNDMGLLDP